MIESEAGRVHLATRTVEIAGTAIIVVVAFGALNEDSVLTDKLGPVGPTFGNSAGVQTLRAMDVRSSSSEWHCWSKPILLRVAYREEFSNEAQPFNCTIRIFNPTDGSTIEEHVLPVDSPDAEHAAASTLANAASFTTKTSSGAEVMPVAFCCTSVKPRV